MKQNITDFLHAHGLNPSAIDTDTVLHDFLSEMEKGLTCEKSSLQMIPTFITTDTDLSLEEPVIVIDAGGTNLRIALIHFNSDGQAIVDEINKHKMPGVKNKLTAKEFFDAFTKYLTPIIDKSQKIGFCFSYPAEISPDRDGKLTHWTKEIKVPEVEGQYIGKGLMNALGNAGKNKYLSLLNDTIATLLAGKAQSADKNCSSYVGLILGTGTNIAYIESNANIPKLNNLDAKGNQAINVESGGFALTPRGDLDKALDDTTINPGDYQFEKMIAGCYRGDLILLALRAASKEKLFSEEYAEHIYALDNLDGMHADMFLKSSTEGPLAAKTMTSCDEETLQDIINGIYRRTAKLIAINITAAVLKSGKGFDPTRPVCINIDGTTYYKSVGFKKMVETYLQDILGQRKISYILMHVEDAPLIGAAIGGLS